jgi:hypothetical protein
MSDARQEPAPTVRKVSLAEYSPTLAAEWHPTLNDGLLPSDVSYGSARKVHWLCGQGHAWVASCAKRTSGRGCPVCAGKVCVLGVNDLATTNPDVAAEWHPTLNEQRADSVLRGSSKKVWWQCAAGHEWQISPNQRTSPKGTGCPVCSGRLVVAGTNDLATTHASLAAEWHPTKNLPMTPSNTRAWTNRRVWWRCAEGHEWKASGNQRTTGTGCPVCRGMVAITGVTDMATTHASLAAEWHPTKNLPLLPSMVVAGTASKLWWRCAEGHEWQASGNSRTSRGSGCPYCAHQKVVPGVNDMATTHASLAAEWHPDRNLPVTPDQVFAGTNKLVWWQCVEGHVWQARASARVAGTGCPTCATYGFDPHATSLLYFLEHAELRARKVGITNLGTTRLRDFQRAGWTTLRTWESPSGVVVQDAEREVLQWVRQDLGLPPFLAQADVGRTGGWSETFSADGPTNAQVEEKIEQVWMAVEVRVSPVDGTGQ